MSVADPIEQPRPAATDTAATGGVDPANSDHAVTVVAPDGEQIERFSIPHDTAGLRGRVDPALLHTRLTGAPRGATGPHAEAGAAVSAAFVATLRAITTQIQALAARIGEPLDLHPDAPIFTSLPRSGRVRAARLLAESGDARGRFPTADSPACLAGVAPSTRRSGKLRAVTFCWGADRQLRPHAVRVLARAGINVIRACWTTHSPYDPDKHHALRAGLEQDQPTAA